MNHLRLVVFTTAAVLALGACADSGPATVRIFGLNPATRQYGFFDARLESLVDVTEMRGDTVVFRGNATLVGDALAAAGDAKSTEILRVEGGEAPACSFTEVGGVLHANDYDSLNMASSYWSLEQARKLFIELGVPASERNALTAWYEPRIQMLTKLIPTFWFMTDNAAYAPGFDGFLIVPHLVIDGAPPFSANLGVMAHEYAHRVFNRIVERGANIPAWQEHDWDPPAANQFRGLDEGLADVFGYLATLDPDFIGPSLGEQAHLVDRDMTRVRIMEEEDVVKVLTGVAPGEEDPIASYDPHELGAFVAAAMWSFGEAIGDHRRVGVAILAVQRDLAEAIAAQPKYDFSAIEFFDRLTGKFEKQERQILCEKVKERFQLLVEADFHHSLTRCP